MNYKELVYFDIETAGMYADLESLKLNDIRGYELFMRKIERKSSQILDWKEDPNDVYLNKSPLIPEFGRIVCVSVSTAVNSVKMNSYYDEDEEVLINKVHKLFMKISNETSMGLCGFYIKGFDVPWLNRKFLIYGLEIPKILKTFNMKPWEVNMIDLSEVWKSFGTLESVSFDEMLYTLNVESPKSVMAGKDVHYNYWINKDVQKIKTYCEADVISCVRAAKQIAHLL
jgi:hypothetical protein